ncbi:unnamed protein product [Ilex paraguariensis]|uniref:Uncharacterized protein n=1 Tax=Ilex paraguariensis TaxID=185542 RepID=A0ABC8TFQ1_9AQUA
MKDSPVVGSDVVSSVDGPPNREVVDASGTQESIIITNNLILLWGVTQKGYPNQAHGIENIANHAFNENHFMVLKDDGVVDIW